MEPQGSLDPYYGGNCITIDQGFYATTAAADRRVSAANVDILMLLGFEQYFEYWKAGLVLVVYVMEMIRLSVFIKWYQRLVRSFDQKKNKTQVQQNLHRWPNQVQRMKYLTTLYAQKTTGLPECADDTITDYSRPSPIVESTLADDQNRNSSASENGESTDSILSKPTVKFVKAAERSTTNIVKTVKKPYMRYAELYRKPLKKYTVRGNQQNWNNLKSQQLGENFRVQRLDRELKARTPIHKVDRGRSRPVIAWVPKKSKSYDSYARMVPASAKIKEKPFTISPNMYKEYLTESWYSAKTLENSKVFFSIPTGGINDEVGVNTFRNAIGAHYLPHSSKYVAPPSINIVRPLFETIMYGEPIPAKGTLKKSLLPPRWSEGLETVLTQPVTGKGASSVARKIEEETSSKIKLEYLAKLVSHVQPNFKDLDSPEDDLFIVINDSDEDEDDEVHATENVESEDTLVPKSPSLSSLPTELKDLPTKFNELTEEVASVQAKLKTLDALPDLLLNVTKVVNKFAHVLDSTSSKARDQSVLLAGQADTRPTKGEKDTNQATIS
nr:hypothetical protein [Tanacetum cinerariifolium]